MGQANQTFQASPGATTVGPTAGSGVTSASTTLPGGVSNGSALRVYNSTAFPITFATSAAPGGAVATATGTPVAPGLTEIFSMNPQTTDVAAYGIGGAGVVYFTRGDGI